MQIWEGMRKLLFGFLLVCVYAVLLCLGHDVQLILDGGLILMGAKFLDEAKNSYRKWRSNINGGLVKSKGGGTNEPG